MNDYDQCARYAVRKLRPIELFRWLFGEGFFQAWRHRGWLDTQGVAFPGLPDRRCDTAASFTATAGDEPPLAVVLEFMSVTRHATPRRMIQYVTQIQADCPYQRDPLVEYTVVGVILNLRGAEQSGRYESRASHVANTGIQADFQVRTLAEESAEELLGKVESGELDRSLLVWAPLMTGADTEDYIRRWRAALSQEGDATIRGNVVGLGVVFSNLARRSALWKKGVQGMDEERSEVVMEWETRGEARGIEIGEARGVAVGEARALHQSLLQFLTARFSSSVSASITTLIQAETDSATLMRWVSLAANCASIDEFEQGIGG